MMYGKLSFFLMFTFNTFDCEERTPGTRNEIWISDPDIRGLRETGYTAVYNLSTSDQLFAARFFRLHPRGHRPELEVYR